MKDKVGASWAAIHHESCHSIAALAPSLGVGEFTHKVGLTLNAEGGKMFRLLFRITLRRPSLRGEGPCDVQQIPGHYPTNRQDGSCACPKWEL
jgi:hypothetical protein